MANIARVGEQMLKSFEQIDIGVNTASVIRLHAFLQHSQAAEAIVLDTSLKVPVFLALGGRHRQE